MSSFHYRALEMSALVFCQDNAFLPTMNQVLKGLGLQTNETADYDHALTLIAKKPLDAVVIDWQEVVNLGEFLGKIRKSPLNHDTVQVVIARDLMDMRQAFSMGVQFLIHKPASHAQISGCLEAMLGAVLKQRRRGHRESVRISADVTARGRRLLGPMIVNVGTDGLGLLLNTRSCNVSAELSVGGDIEFAFRLPETKELIVGNGVTKWISRDGAAGNQFREGKTGYQSLQPNAGLQFQCISDVDTENVERWVADRFNRVLGRMRESERAGLYRPAHATKHTAAPCLIEAGK